MVIQDNSRLHNKTSLPLFYPKPLHNLSSPITDPDHSQHDATYGNRHTYLTMSEPSAATQLQELLTRVHGDNWIDQEEFNTTLPHRAISRYNDQIPIGSPIAIDFISDRQVPDNISEDVWNEWVGIELVNAMLSYDKKEYLSSTHLQALMTVAFRGIPRDQIMCESNVGWTLQNASQGSFDHSTRSCIISDRPKNILMFAHRDLSDEEGTREDNFNTPHWILVIHNLEHRFVYMFDPISQGAEERARSILYQLRHAWKRIPGVRHPKQGRWVDVMRQSDGWGCGYFGAIMAYMIVRRPHSLIHSLDRIIFDPHDFVNGMFTFAIPLITGIALVDEPVDQRFDQDTPMQEEIEPTMDEEEANPTDQDSEPYESSEAPVPRSYNQILDLAIRHPPNPSTSRADQYKIDLQTPYVWPEDTWDDIGNRPQPCHPVGWQGWDDYHGRMSQVDSAQHTRNPDQDVAREERAKGRLSKRRMSAELLELGPKGKVIRQ
ncbi:hypothetical protein F4677DRAFT_439474 [Hypoxylon crocopeplum]|nr:hypothetical protein F4677DRAFT_439474 [Hypoxylon crocopeplum]